MHRKPSLSLLTMSAKINVPFYPVPMTMQTFAVIMIGAAFGWRLGAATVLFYLAQGAVGFPVFAGTPEKGIGLAVIDERAEDGLDIVDV